jgi:hypothetical protein
MPEPGVERGVAAERYSMKSSITSVLFPGVLWTDAANRSFLVTSHSMWLCQFNYSATFFVNIAPDDYLLTIMNLSSVLLCDQRWTRRPSVFKAKSGLALVGESKGSFLEFDAWKRTLRLSVESNRSIGGCCSTNVIAPSTWYITAISWLLSTPLSLHVRSIKNRYLPGSNL